MLIFALLIIKLLDSACQPQFRTTPGNRQRGGKARLKSQPFLLGFGPELQPWYRCCYKTVSTPENHSRASALQSCTWQLMSKSQPFSGKDGSKGWASKCALCSDFHAKHKAVPWESGLWFSLARPCQQAMKAGLLLFALFLALELSQQLSCTKSMAEGFPPAPAEQLKRQRRGAGTHSNTSALT